MMHSLKLNNSLYNNNKKPPPKNGVHEGFKMEPREWPNI